MSNELPPTPQTGENIEQTITEARLATLDPQQFEALCETAREGIQTVVQFSIEPESED